jgi:hypothetical protein
MPMLPDAGVAEHPVARWADNDLIDIDVNAKAPLQIEIGKTNAWLYRISPAMLAFVDGWYGFLGVCRIAKGGHIPWPTRNG